jgi:hypothetical protein
MESSTATVVAGLRPTRLLDGLDACLFTHAIPSQARWVTRLSGFDNIGAVYSLRGATRSTLKDLARRHQSVTGTTSDLLIDAGLYLGNGRDLAGGSLDPDWIRDQHRAGLRWALTDSGYVDEGDAAGLDSILHQAARLGDGVIATLPVHKRWLTERADELLRAIEEACVPVALMVEDVNDPFGTVRAVKGLIHLLGGEIPILSLRNDISAIGAIAFGAVAGAIGTRTSTRHFVPRSEGGGGNRGKPAAVVPAALAYRQLERIADAYRREPNSLHWRCSCAECGGQTLNWVVEEDAAFIHSALSLGTVAARVLNSPSPDDRRKSWIESCKFAQSVNYEIESMAGVPWEPPKFQNAWVKACPRISAN